MAPRSTTQSMGAFPHATNIQRREQAKNRPGLVTGHIPKQCPSKTLRRLTTTPTDAVYRGPRHAHPQPAWHEARPTDPRRHLLPTRHHSAKLDPKQLPDICGVPRLLHSLPERPQGPPSSITAPIQHSGKDVAPPLQPLPTCETASPTQASPPTKQSRSSEVCPRVAG